MTTVDPQPGDWVLIRAKVLSRLTPENVEVELFSATDQYGALVRVDRCEITEKPIPDEPGPGSVVLLGGVAYQTLTAMKAGWRRPGSKQAVTWEELNTMGDVEVIHHG